MSMWSRSLAPSLVTSVGRYSCGRMSVRVCGSTWPSVRRAPRHAPRLPVVKALRDLGVEQQVSGRRRRGVSSGAGCSCPRALPWHWAVNVALEGARAGCRHVRCAFRRLWRSRCGLAGPPAASGARRWVARRSPGALSCGAGGYLQRPRHTLGRRCGCLCGAVAVALFVHSAGCVLVVGAPIAAVRNPPRRVGPVAAAARGLAACGFRIGDGSWACGLLLRWLYKGFWDSGRSVALPPALPRAECAGFPRGGARRRSRPGGRRGRPPSGWCSPSPPCRRLWLVSRWATLC